MTTERPEVPTTAGERATLRAFLDFHRATLAMKCDGLTDEQLRRAASPPSALSLLGLVRHMAEAERVWFRRVIRGEGLPLVWSADGDFQAAYDTSGSSREETFIAWRTEIAHARTVETSARTLDVTGTDPRTGEPVSLRRVMHHMVQEYARHNGHADLIREALDGTVGV